MYFIYINKNIISLLNIHYIPLISHTEVFVDCSIVSGITYVKIKFK